MGHLQVVLLLLGVSDDMLAEEFNSGKLLSAAVRETELEILRYLLTEGLKTEIREEYINKALIRHAGSKNVVGAATVVYLCFLAQKNVGVENFDINSKYADEQTVLMWAARHGEIDIVKYLNEQGANLTTSDSSGNTALQVAGLNYQLSIVDYLLDVQEVKSDEFNSLLLNISEFALKDPTRSMFVTYQGDFYKSLIKIFSGVGDQATKQQGMLLKHIYIALQAKDSCSTPKHKIEKTKNNVLSSRNQDGDDKVATKEKKMLKELLGQELYGNFKKKIEQIRNDQEKLINEKTDRWLIADKIHSKYIKRSYSCVNKMKSKLTTCCKSAKTTCNYCLDQCCCGKQRNRKRKSSSKLPEPPHKCKSRGNFALISCSLAVLFYMLDLITDFTVGFEDYNGFSKNLGIFEMILVGFTLMHENIRSSISLFSTEEELLRIKVGKTYITTYDWEESDLLKGESRVKQILIKIFCPFAVRRKDGCLQCFKAVIYNLLTILQLRPVVDRLRVLMHCPTSLRVIYRHRTEQDSLKQFYLITEQIPELLIQFYTLQIVFNIAGGAQSGDNQIISVCGGGHNFSYPRFTDSLNNPNKTSWFCNEIPIDTAGGLMKCEIFFRLFSAMIPFFMIPSGIVSLEVGLRLLDAATPKMSTIVQCLLQAAYTLMIPARLLMFAALIHAVLKEIIFVYALLRVALELLSNLFSFDQFFSTNVNKENISTQRNRSRVKTLKRCLSKLYEFLNTIWRLSMFSVRDVFAVSIREPQAYMISPSNVTYQSIRERNSLTKRCAIFLLEGLVGAWIIEEFYPCGRHSEKFRYIGWMCLASLLLSVTVITLISDVLHPQHLLTDDKDVLKRLLKTAGLSVVFGIVSSLVFIMTQLRTSTEKRVLLGIVVHVLISGILILVIKFFAYPSEKKGKDVEDSTQVKASESAQSCCFGLCCPSKSFHKYSKVSKGSTEDMVNESSHCQNIRAAEMPKNIMPSDSIETNLIETRKAMTMNPCRDETDLNNLRGTVHEKNTKVTISEQPLSNETITRKISSKGTVLELTAFYKEVIGQAFARNSVPEQTSWKVKLLEPTSPNGEVPGQTSLNEEVPEQRVVIEEVKEPTFLNKEVLEQTVVNKKVQEQTSLNEKVLEKTSSNEEVLEHTSLNEEVPEQTVVNKEVQEQTTLNVKLILEQTCSNEEVLVQTSLKEEVLEQISSNKEVLEQTSLNVKVLVQTSSNEEVLEHTSLNEEVLEQISSNEEVLEHTSLNEEVLEQISSNEEVLEQTSLNEEVPGQTVVNKEVKEQTSLNVKLILEQTSSNEEVLVQTSLNEEVLEQISSNEEVLVQTSLNEEVLEQTSSNKKS